MMVKDTARLARYLKRKKALLLTGALCDEVAFDGTRLLDVAADIAKKLGVPVAATGNTPLGLKERGVGRVKKMWLAEVLNYLRYPWQDSVSPQKPDLLIFIGYSPEVARRFVTAVTDADTVVLGNTYIEEATYSLPDANFAAWLDSLSRLAEALGSA